MNKKHCTDVNCVTLIEVEIEEILRGSEYLPQPLRGGPVR